MKKGDIYICTAGVLLNACSQGNHQDSATEDLVEVIVLGAVILLLLVLAYRHMCTKRRYTSTVKELHEVQQSLEKVVAERDKAKRKLQKKAEEQLVLQNQIMDKKTDSKFKEHFMEAYPTFLPRLRNRIPSITPKEELYCMLILLNTKNEELASIFNVNRQSVIVAKYRIRKKMDLQEGESIEQFLRDIQDQDT